MKKRALQKSKRLGLSATALSLAVFFVACGKMGSPSKIKVLDGVKQNLVQSTANNGGFPQDTAHTCPAQPNILPLTGSYHSDGSDRYTLCPAKANETAFSIHGVPHSSGGPNPKICVFPYLVIDATQSYPVWDQNNVPYAQCLPMTNQTMVFSFPGTVFNAVFIVDDADKDLMSYCLTQSNWGLCPAGYSFGWFRNSTDAQ